MAPPTYPMPPTSPAPALSARSAPAGRGAAPSPARYNRIICNAGALRVGDAVSLSFFEPPQVITAIVKQSDDSCACVTVDPHGHQRARQLSSVNALIAVVAGPTLAAANLDPALPLTPTREPVYRVK
jgi:hypothetical protein